MVTGEDLGNAANEEFPREAASKDRVNVDVREAKSIQQPLKITSPEVLFNAILELMNGNERWIFDRFQSVTRKDERAVRLQDAVALAQNLVVVIDVLEYGETVDAVEICIGEVRIFETGTTEFTVDVPSRDSMESSGTLNVRHRNINANGAPAPLRQQNGLKSAATTDIEDDFLAGEFRATLQFPELVRLEGTVRKEFVRVQS
jgi:hypothetical protein